MMEQTKKRFQIHLTVPKFLKRWDSLFYFGVAIFILGLLHVVYGLYVNHFATTYNWDYSVQFLPFAYDFYDDWRTFFSTGKFPLYSTRVFLGTDNIGSNAYYSLLDPFLIPSILFPRDFIPQYFVLSTAAKFIVTAFGTRAYLRYMGIKETMSRVGAIAVAFSGYANFMIGFPTTISSLAFFPILLYGIEKTVREQKPFWIILAIFLEGITSFFTLVIICIFGVLYALWRFFATIKTRKAKQNIMVMVLGVGAFAVGLCLCAFAVLPSIRQSTLTGRTSSIGGAYLDMLKKSISSRDLRSFFALMFEEIGDHPGREVIAFTSFFFPTGGFYAMPWARSGYDSWTASIFCYTPFVILFFTALIHSLLQRKWHHFLAIFLLLMLFLTQFSHFAFYAFTGNGYGRWYFVLIPLIVYYGCWGFQQRTTSSRWIPLTGAVLALCSTLIAYFLLEHILKGQTFTNTNGMTYWQSSYQVPSDYYNGLDTPWFLYYQIAWIVVECALLVYGHRKKWTPHFLFGALAIEIIVMGNLTFVYNGIWWLDSLYAGGKVNREATSWIANKINGQDSSFFRTYSDTIATKYGQHVAGINGASDFHSLMNFDTETFALQNQIKKPGGSRTSYETSNIYNPNWSGGYMNKRLSMDYLLGYRYYIIKNDYMNWRDYDPDNYFPAPNVPLGAVEIPEASFDRDQYRVYKVSEDYMPNLGFAVGDELYRVGHQKDSFYKTAFFNYYSGISSFRELLRVEEVQLRGAMVEDDVELPEEFALKEVQKATDALKDYGVKILRNWDGFKADYYQTKNGDGFFPNIAMSYFKEGPGFFVNHHESVLENVVGRVKMQRDLGKMAIRPGEGTYFNVSNEGCYMEIKTYPNQYDSGTVTKEWDTSPRIYAIGDITDESGNPLPGKENIMLGYEFYSLDNIRGMEGGNGYYNNSTGTFGLYCKGRVKYLVFNYKGSGEIGFSLDNLSVVCQDYSELEAKLNPLRNDALKNVKRDVNSFTFETAYTKNRIVKTQLGYDAGWQVTAHVPGEGNISCQMLKLDGGLVGFVAPGRLDENNNPIQVTYDMVYVTPYSKLSAVAWVFGVVTYSAFAIGSFLISAKQKRKETEIAA